MIESREAPERSLEETVSRALRDNLVPLKRTATELEQAFADFVAACSSARPSNSLPAMLRAQACAASLSASLAALSNFTVIALNSPGLASGTVAEERSRQPAVASVAVVSEERPAAAHHAPVATPHREELQLEPVPEIHAAHAEPASSQPVHAQELELEPYPSHAPATADGEVPTHTAAVPEGAAPSEAAFDISTFPAEIQDLHRRANRVAKVAMQDIKLLRPQDVQMGREHKDICERLRSDLDKARKEYDRRFRAIQDHPVDYFHRWMVEILAQGNAEALGEYPYPSPVLRH